MHAVYVTQSTLGRRETNSYSLDTYWGGILESIVSRVKYPDNYGYCELKIIQDFFAQYHGDFYNIHI